MAAVGTAHVQCPDCGAPIPITVQTRSMTSVSNHLMLVVEPDFTDVWAHSWTHDQ